VGVLVAAERLVEIGEHCMLANGCFVTDSSHRYDDPEKPITWQGFESKGSTRIGDNCWFGANAVVTRDVPPGCTVAGVPAKVVERTRARELIL
jgi:acetyltransferase-like isoleucine patch superfamily enzyme